jgi:hypothetical protein
MKHDKSIARVRLEANNRASIHGAQRRTLEAIFKHPQAHNLGWIDVVELIGEIGTIDQNSSGEYELVVADKHHLIHKPHTKELTGSAVVDLRHFLQDAGWSPDAPSEALKEPELVPPILLVVVDHHGAKIYRIAPAAGDPSAQEISPYDPYRFLHHLTHKGQSGEAGQRAPEDATFYERIAKAAAMAGKIIVVGHGTGKSNAAEHLAQYLRTHHHEIYKRVVSELTADLSSITRPQLLVLAEQALSPVT